MTPAETALASLAGDPPDPATFPLLQSFEADSRVGLFYVYEKPGVRATMAQHRSFVEGRIAELHLVFDSADFA